MKGAVPATQLLHVKEEEVTDEEKSIYSKEEVEQFDPEEESIKQTPSRRRSKKRHTPNDNATSELKVSEIKGQESIKPTPNPRPSKKRHTASDNATSELKVSGGIEGKQTPNSGPNKQQHNPGDDASSKLKVSGFKDHGHGNLLQSPCRAPEPSSANKILWKHTPSSELADIFEAYRDSLKRKAKRSTLEAGIQKKAIVAGSCFFTTEDEVALLQSVIAFKEENGHEPVTSSDFEALHAAVKAQLHVDYDTKQTRRKFTHLKEKYSKKFIKEKTTEKNTDPHMLTAYALAKKLWDVGNDDEGGEFENGEEEFENGEALSVKQTGKTNNANPTSTAPEALPSSSNGDHASIINFIADEFKYTSHDFVRNKFANMCPVDKEEIKDIWNEFQQKEMEFQSHRLEVAKRLIDKMKAI